MNGAAAAGGGSGFTLLELMVVLAIIAIVFVGAVVLVPDERRHDAAGERFAALFALARDRAMLRGETLGLEVWRGGYRFRRYDHERGWTAVEAGDPLAGGDLPEGIRPELQVEREPVSLASRPGGEPQVYVLASGESTPFELRLRAESGTAVVARDMLGRPAEAGEGAS